MPSNASSPAAADIDVAVRDLGPLAWVVDELRKSLEASSKALKRFVRDADAARGSDLAAVDAGQLRISRQQLHQAVGALEMVGLTEPALLLRAMEAVVQRFLQHPETCTSEAGAKIERASFALTEYLDGLLANRAISAISLFPQYRELRELVRADRIHPADLWAQEWRWIPPVVEFPAPAVLYSLEARKVLDQCVLQLMRGKALRSAQKMSQLCVGLAAGQTELQARTFWTLSAAVFEALSLDLLPVDVYIKRVASRVLIQYTSLSKGNSAISERLALDLLFFCAQAAPAQPGCAPLLGAIRVTYGLTAAVPADYETIQFGRFDPALLAQARKRITAAKEMWSSFSAGDLNKIKAVTDQFSLVSESLVKLHAPSQPLALALSRAVDTAVMGGAAPRVELAMEVATSMLYLEAAFEDLDPNDPQMTVRMANLAERLEGVRVGGMPQPLQSWMEELYRRVSDKQTMGSVVGELRTSLGDLEASLDVFFRDPTNKAVLGTVPRQLAQMRGVLSVLGLEQAAQAVLRMRDTVESMISADQSTEGADSAVIFDQLGNNLGALSFLIDMLNYQPALAKQLFVYDEEKGELRPLMGRTGKPVMTQHAAARTPEALSNEIRELVQEVDAGIGADKLTHRLGQLATDAELAGLPAMAKTVHEAAATYANNKLIEEASALTVLASTFSPVEQPPVVALPELVLEEDDLLDVFLEEAREVVTNGQEAVVELQADPASVMHLTVLRRAFHTLKGSGRMVGLTEFGEAAWALEQLINSWLADQKAASHEFLAFCNHALGRFGQWAADIEAKRDSAWSAEPFRLSADALRHGAPPESAGKAPAANTLTLSETDTSVVSVFADVSGEDLMDLQLGGETAPSSETSADALPVIDVSAPELSASSGLQTPFIESTLPLAADQEWMFELAGDGPQLAPKVPEPDGMRVSSIFGEIATAQPVELSDADFLAHFSSDADSVEVALLQTSENRSDTEKSSLGAWATDNSMTPTDAEDSRVSFELSTSRDTPSLGKADSDAASDDPHAGHQALVDDEQVKVIGSLRIGIPLYNVYLNEADEWSRRLATEVAEWVMDSHEPVAESTVALAHSLAGSSATVGFHALSEMARALESALDHSRAHHTPNVALHGQVFMDATEDIRRLLHQFAAGFLKQPDGELLERLKQLEFPESMSFAAADLMEPSPESFFSTSLQAEVFHPAPLVRSEDVTALRAMVNLGEVDDDIDAVDAIDFELFPIFEEEAQELLPQLGGAMRQWFARPENQSARMEVLRALHTLKGSARLAGALRLGEMAHRMESDIDYLGSTVSNPHELEPLLGRFDAIQADFDRLRIAGAAQLESFASTASQNPETQFAPPASVTPIEAASPVGESAAVVEPLVASGSASQAGTVGATDGVPPLVRRSDIPAPQAMALQPLRQSSTASIRVRSQLLDRMVNQAGEVMITRSRLEAELGQLRSALGDMSGNLDRLRQQLRDIEVQAESQMQSRLAQAKESQASFDPLEFDRFTRVQELTRMMAESVNDVATVQRTLQRTVDATEDDLVAQGRQTRELQRDLLRTRMVEFEGISDRLYRVVRQASKDTGKQVRLDLLGGTIEMDRGMLDRMTPAFEHLLRNCVAHGIETPQGRQSAGKDPVGLITVHLRQEGNDVSVDFSDDGSGLDLSRIREKALGLGLVQPGQVINDQDASNLIFLPGFSTAQQVTELSGRGIGMDVVRSEVNALGGRIETTTHAGQGTHFKLVLPLTTAVTQVVMVRSGSLSVGVPANVVETVRRVSAADLEQAYRTGVLAVAGEDVPFFWSGALLQSSSQSGEVAGKTTQVVIFRSAAQRVALHVDEVIGNREVVVKNLGPQLSRLPGLAGMSVLASGAVVLIYNPVAMVAVYGQQARRLSAETVGEVPSRSGADAPKATTPLYVAPRAPLILVVDDSITVRRVTQRLLQREGYRVVMAADGLQALERLLDERPSVVLSDIEMPRMDGFDLARNIRSDARLAGLPIVMITSRIAEKHREHAMSLGVDHYLGKPYSEEELMGLVRHYCSVESAVGA